MTMLADNAEVEAVNATDPDVTPDAEPEIVAEVEVTESEAADSTEAEAQPDISELIRSIPSEKLVEHDVVKGLIARERESARQKAEHETTTKMFAEQQKYVVSGQAEAALQALAEAAADNLDDRGRARIDQNEVKRLTAALLSHGASVSVNQLANVLAEEVGDGFSLSEAEQNSITLAQQRYMQNPLDPSALQRAWLAPLKRAWVERERENIRSEVRAEIKREQEAAQKAAKAAAAATARNESPKPTTVSGTPSAGPVTWESINQTYTDSQWARLPIEERKRLSEQANAARLKG